MYTTLNFQRYREDLFLLVIFIMMAIAIVVKSYFHVDGYLTPDSADYLRLAQNLLDGNGYYVAAYGITDQDREMFAKWPVAYPTFIFFISKLTGLSLFWASKFLNIILLGVILSIFRILFKNNAYIYGMILFFASYIEIFSYTWSETLFITALLWFTSAIYFFIKNPKKTLSLYLSLTLASLLLFMSRYIGAMSFGLIGLIGLYYAFIKKERLTAMILIAIAILNIAIMILYLYHNYADTGFITGMQRIPSHETNIELVDKLSLALFSELLIVTASKGITIKTVLMFNIEFIVFTLLLWKYRNKIFLAQKEKIASIQLSTIFLLTAVVYLFFIILIRWRTQFDIYDFRLLGPGSFLLFIAFIFFIQTRTTKQFFTAFKRVVISFAILSFLYNVPYKVWESSKFSHTYFETLNSVKENFKTIDKESIVLFAPKHIRYLYPEIQVREPDSYPYSVYKEKWSEFMDRMYVKNKSIYLFVPLQPLSTNEFDQSVVDFVNQYDKESVVKLK